jgi:hypothetical protein
MTESLILLSLISLHVSLFHAGYTVQTVAADLRQEEHIPKMQNDIVRKSKLHVLRQPRSKDRGGGVLFAVRGRAPRGPTRHGTALGSTQLP